MRLLLRVVQDRGVRPGGREVGIRQGEGGGGNGIVVVVIFRVRELNETFREDVGLRDLVFVPSTDSVERAVAGGKYKLVEMILTK